MASNYYDLDDILADAEKVPSRFNLTVPGLGFLEGKPGKSIVKDTKLDLPVWLAESLAACAILEGSDERFIELLEPDFISPKVLNAIQSNPVTVDLHSILTNYYKLVEKWALMYEDRDLIETSMQMLKERAFEISNFANNTNKQMNNGFIFSLDEFEKKLFKLTSDSSRQMKKWNE